MKYLFFTLLLICISLENFAQETISILKDKDSYYEEYYVLKSDKKTKHGSYIKLDRPIYGGLFIESFGSYSQGKKSGYWEAYYPNRNNIKSKGNYNKDGLKEGRWTYFYPETKPLDLFSSDSENGASFQVMWANPTTAQSGNYSNGEKRGVWDYFDEAGFLRQQFDHDSDSLVYSHNADLENIEAGYIGGEFFLKQHLNETFDFPAYLQSSNNTISLNTGMIIFLFTIDEKGKIVNITEIEDTIKNKKIYNRALATTQSLDSKWYPEKKNGTKQASTKTIAFELQVETKHSSFVTDQWSFSNTSNGFKMNITVK